MKSFHLGFNFLHYLAVWNVFLVNVDADLRLEAYNVIASIFTFVMMSIRTDHLEVLLTVEELMYRLKPFYWILKSYTGLYLPPYRKLF